MKLLIVADDFPDICDSRVTGIFIKEQIKSLSHLVDEINVLVPVHLDHPIRRRSAYEDYGLAYNAKVFFVKYFNPVYPVAYFMWKSQWIKSAAIALIRFIKERGISFDLVHAHYTWPSGAIANLIKDEFDKPFIITEHTSQTLERALRREDRWYISTWKRCDAIIRVRKKDIPLIAETGVPADKLFYVPNGFDAAKFREMDKGLCRKKLNLPESKKLILNVANFYSKVKGHEILIKALSKVQLQHEEIYCVLIGDGKLKDRIQKLIVEEKLSDRVLLMGSKPHSEIPAWINAADIFVLPSLSESFGVVQIEAMACGKPVVATMNGGSEEIIISDDYGLLCKPGDPEGLAEKILMALDREWDQEKIRKYAEQFTWDNIAKQLLKIYESVLNE